MEQWKASKHRLLWVAVVNRNVSKRDAPIKNGISIYTDDSKNENFPTEAVFSSELKLAIKHNLPLNSLIFFAEAWAIYQALILLESS